MKFGIRLPNSGPLANRKNIVEVADEAEKLGFHSLWQNDHIVWGTEQHRTHLSSGSAEALQQRQSPNFFESVTTLSYLAGRLRKINVGVAVLVLPLRNLVVIAKELANLDVLSEGRLILGVAPGAPKITEPEFAAVGVPYNERGKITDEYINAIRRIWSDDLPSFSGKYVAFKQVEIFPKPVQRPPKILIGGGERGISPRALKRVVELGDGWIPAYLTPDEISEGRMKISEEARRTGRDPKSFMISHETFALIHNDSDKASQLSKSTLLTSFVSQEEGEKRTLIGNPKVVTDRLRKYKEVGADMTELKFIYPDIPSLLEMMTLFMNEVAPSFEK
ncbi:MAG TPA: LLM class flavin-dependent oxidoreductase [Nitrososphaerales archaeon]|nr:LLM class flavin-dependent oxidoreductase [Nitrososphaerales archaeon]